MKSGKKALLIIDMVNDFVLDEGTLQVPDARNIVLNIKDYIEEFHKNNDPVIYINDSHDPKDSEFNRWPPHSIKGTKGSQVFDEIKPQEQDYVINKRRYSGFYGTSLDLLLNELDVEELVITGTVTNICILATALDAYMRGFKLLIPENSVAGLDANDHSQALKQMEDIAGAEII